MGGREVFPKALPVRKIIKIETGSEWYEKKLKARTGWIHLKKKKKTGGGEDEGERR